MSTAMASRMALRRQQTHSKLHRMQSFREFNKSFREGREAFSLRIKSDEMKLRKRLKKMPRWLKISKKIYHQYGLKHVMLLMIFLVYQFAGAAIFYWIEKTADVNKEKVWKKQITTNRTLFINKLIPSMFNNSDFLLFLDAAQTQTMYDMLQQNLIVYETQLNIKYSDQKFKWDFWNAMLYAGTICTTIGYGHLYPITVSGQLLTMIYAIFGIPLVLSILDDLGKVLTKVMKYPWMLFKMGCRRAFKYCTKQTMEDIRRVDAEDRAGLAIFDLPIPVALFIVVAWIFVCAATFCIWEDEWNYFHAFYFFFISLSTIGLGDIVPDKPKYLLMLFGYIIIGLSLVSMCVNLIQAKLEQSYDAGLEDLSEEGEHGGGGLGGIESAQNSPRTPRRSRRSRSHSYRGAVGAASHSSLKDQNKKPLAVSSGREGGTDGGGSSTKGGGGSGRSGGATMGVLQRQSSYSLSSKASGSPRTPKKTSKMSQTLLSFPSPLERQSKSAFKQLFHSTSKSRIIPTTFSIDDVMRLVDTEEDDVIILSELSTQCFDQGNSHVKEIQANIESEPMIVYEGDGTSLTALMGHHHGSNELHDIEELEELEDQILLGASSPYGRHHHRLDPISDNSSRTTIIQPRLPRRSRLDPHQQQQQQVHFRSRLSLISPDPTTSSVNNINNNNNASMITDSASSASPQPTSSSHSTIPPSITPISAMKRTTSGGLSRSGGGALVHHQQNQNNPSEPSTSTSTSMSRPASSSALHSSTQFRPTFNRRYSETVLAAAQQHPTSSQTGRRVLSEEALLEEPDTESLLQQEQEQEDLNYRSRSYYKIS